MGWAHIIENCLFSVNYNYLLNILFKNILKIYFLLFFKFIFN